MNSNCFSAPLLDEPEIRRPLPTARGERIREAITSNKRRGTSPPWLAWCFGVAKATFWRLEGYNLELEFLAGSESNVRQRQPLTWTLVFGSLEHWTLWRHGHPSHL